MAGSVHLFNRADVPSCFRGANDLHFIAFLELIDQTGIACKYGVVVLACRNFVPIGIKRAGWCKRNAGFRSRWLAYCLVLNNHRFKSGNNADNISILYLAVGLFHIWAIGIGATDGQSGAQTHECKEKKMLFHGNRVVNVISI
jgi:hypothetical protein